MGQKILVSGLNIYYEKIGSGPKVVLFLPGGCGTGRSDFTPQLEGFDPEKFTIIAWDPPGYGQSRPPKREYHGEKTFSNDADIANQMMIKLGYQKYSLLGWSDGGRTGMLIAIQYPENVESLLMIGSASYKTKSEGRVLDLIENLNFWDETTLAPYLKVYTKQDFQSLWSTHVKYYRTINNICKDKVHMIRCPVFFVVGGKDPLCTHQHALFYSQSIPKFKIHTFPMGVHNVHHVYAAEFNRLAQEFFLNNN